MTRRAAAMLLVAAVWSAPAIAADLDVKPPSEKPAPPAATIFSPPDAACVEWTDGCRVCAKPATGEATCSNIGAACTPQPARCTRR